MKRLLLLALITVLTIQIVQAAFVDDGSPSQNLYACGTVNTTGAVYFLTSTINSTGTCVTVGAHNIRITGNGKNIINYSTFTVGYGIYNPGYTALQIDDIIIKQHSTASASHGIFYSGTSAGLIVDTDVITRGNGLAGMYIVNAVSTDVSQCTVSTAGTSAYGVFFQSGTSFHIINDTSFTTSGQNGHALLYANSDNNRAWNITTSTAGPGGISVLYSSADKNKIWDLDGTSTGISGHGLTYSSSVDNNATRIEQNITGNNAIGLYVLNAFRNNVSKINVTKSGTGGRGIWFVTNPSDNIVTDFFINTTNEIGVHVTNGGKNNSFYNGTVISGSDGIRLEDSTSDDNYFENLSLDVSAGSSDIFIDDNNITGTEFINMPVVGVWNITLAKIIVGDLDLGALEFTGFMFGDGTNFSDAIRIRNNSITVESGEHSGLNTSANVAIFGSPASPFDDPAILRNNETCPDSICTLLTDINAATVVFNVTHWTNYSIGESTIPLIITILSPDNNTIFNTSIINFTVSTTKDADWCGMSLDGGNNVTMQNLSLQLFNFTNSSVSDGNHEVIFHCNTSTGFTEKSGTNFFTVDTTNPLINFTFPTPSNNSNQTNTDIYVNISSSDLIHHYTFLDFNSDLLLWMRFDDVNSSGDPTDLSIYGNNGSLNGTTITPFGVFGNYLDTSTGTSAIIPDNGPLLDVEIGKAITISLWFRDAAPTSKDTILSKGISSDRSYCIMWGRFDLRKIEVCNAGTFLLSDDNLNDGLWHHLAFKIDDDDDELAFWIDGTKQFQTGVVNTFGDNIYDVLIGDTQVSGREEGNSDIDDLIYFNRSLTDTEIKALYNATATQYQNNFTGLAVGNYTFTGYAVDSVAHINQTEDRIVRILPPEGCSCSAVSCDLTCSENCTFSTPIDLAGTIINITGDAGYVLFEAEISNAGGFDGRNTDLLANCYVNFTASINFTS